MLIDLFKNKTKNEPDLKFSKLVCILSQETGIGVITVRNTLRKYFDRKPITAKKRKFRPTANEKIDISEKLAIRRKIHSYWFRRRIPTSKNILLAINADPKIPTLHFKTLKTVLKDLNFEYTKCGTTYALTETEDIVLWRRKYIEDIRRYRNEGRTIYYLEETWVNVGEYPSKDLWVDKEPSGVGKRLIVVHIGSVEGFVEGGLLCYESYKNTSNYYDHMNGDIFYNWFCSILPLLNKNSVIVFDNASYHSVTNYVPTMSWKKDCILRWFEGKGIVFDRPIVKCQLIEKVKQMRFTYDNYRRSVQEAINHNQAVLRLPPYHCELNPMHLAWTAVANHARTQNCTSSKLDDVCQVLNDGVKQVTPEKWVSYVYYSIMEEDQLWNLDFITDNMLEEAGTVSDIVTINLITSSESSGSSD